MSLCEREGSWVSLRFERSACVCGCGVGSEQGAPELKMQTVTVNLNLTPIDPPSVLRGPFPSRGRLPIVQLSALTLREPRPLPLCHTPRFNFNVSPPHETTPPVRGDRPRILIHPFPQTLTHPPFTLLFLPPICRLLLFFFPALFLFAV